MSFDSDLIRFECQLCGACCRDAGLLITLTKNDLIRISFALGFGVSEMLRAVDFHVLEPHVKAPPGLRDFPMIATEQGLAYLALKKQDNGECVFLEANKCMIHPIRPGVCQAFPFVFRKDNADLFWGFTAKKEICPGIGLGEPLPVEDLQAMAKAILDEQSSFRDFVAEWNRRESHATASGFIRAILEDEGLPS